MYHPCSFHITNWLKCGPYATFLCINFQGNHMECHMQQKSGNFYWTLIFYINHYNKICNCVSLNTLYIACIPMVYVVCRWWWFRFASLNSKCKLSSPTHHIPPLKYIFMHVTFTAIHICLNMHFIVVINDIHDIDVCFINQCFEINVTASIKDWWFCIINHFNFVINVAASN